MLRRFAAIALVGSATACSSDSPVSPTPRASVIIAMDSSAVYAGDALALHASIRDAAGHDSPAISPAWSVSDTMIAKVSASGVLTAIRPGAVRITVRAGDLSATSGLTVQPLSVVSVEVVGLPDTLGNGDIMPVGVRATGAGGRVVTGRTVSLRTADAMVATIDPSGRLRAVAPGRTDLVATVDGVSVTRALVVSGDPVELPLRDIDGERLPLLIAADSVEWDGVRMLAEVYAESGSLRLTGGSTPRYHVTINYAQYGVTRLPDGRRNLVLQARFNERDFGTVLYDARGDLQMTSEYTSPVSHTASADSSGIAMRYRIPGDDIILDLFFRREPK